MFPKKLRKVLKIIGKSYQKKWEKMIIQETGQKRCVELYIYKYIFFYKITVLKQFSNIDTECLFHSWHLFTVTLPLASMSFGVGVFPVLKRSSFDAIFFL